MKKSRLRVLTALLMAVCIAVLVSVPTYANSGADVKFSSGVPKIQGVLETKKMKNDIAKTISGDTSERFKAHGLPTEFDVLTVQTGVKIDLSGYYRFIVYPLSNKNGTLTYDSSKKNWDKTLTEKTSFDGAGAYKKGSNVIINEQGYYMISFINMSHTVFEISHESHAPEKMSVILNVVGSKTSDEKAFELKKLQSAVKSMTAELADKNLLDTRIITINNQLTYLNKELAAGKKPANVAAIKSSLQESDKLLKKVDINKLSVYAKANSDKKTDKAELEKTHKRLDTLRKNLDKATKALG